MSYKHNDLPRIGITIGDHNGIGPEVVLKALNDNRIFTMCTPLVYASPKIVNTYKHLLGLEKLQHQILKSKEIDQLSHKALNIVNCLDDEFEVEPGKEDPKAGERALLLLDEALGDLESGYINAVVTAPLNKNLIKTEPEFTGHTEYITRKFDAKESMMFLISDKLRVGLVTNHLPLKEVAANITIDKMLDKLRIMNKCMREDMGFDRPRIAVFGLNPHAGDSGLLGREEIEIIRPAIQKAFDEQIMAFGPYPADGFMGSANYQQFDAILAMYHDQGLVAFKALTFSNGVNYTAGLPVIRTSPDHGTAYDIAGKNEADAGSLRAAIFSAIDIHKARTSFQEYNANPLKRKKQLRREER